MLKKLSVKNFAIIEDNAVEFKDGLTVLTGETGAGKSLIIDCISLLLGERANNEMIRRGEDKAIISGVFTYKNIYLTSLLNNLGVDTSNKELVITRVISPTRSSIKANDTSITLNDLKIIAHYLADIHLQFDMTKLLNKENYLSIVDGFNHQLIKEYKDKYHSSLLEFKEAFSKYQKLLDRFNEIQKNREFYEYDLKELKAMNLKENEEEELTAQISYLKNYDHIYEMMKLTRELIDKDSLSDIYEIKNNLKELASYQSDFNELTERIDNVYFELEDIFDSIKKYHSYIEYDPNLLDELETRSFEINNLKKKHKKSVKELIEYQKELEALIGRKDDDDILLKEEYEKVLSLYKTTYQLALDLSSIRSEVALRISRELENHLSDLALQSKFDIKVTPKKEQTEIEPNIFTEEGIDDVDFFIETNIGEGLKPLNKIISGGEASRIMLAIKALYIKANKVETVIFDEIDTGISGAVASKVANKIYEISLSTQVITITHLPQVAALSKNHIRISKSIENGRTHTSIKELNLDEKIKEIALMISEGKLTDKQIEYAKEMVLKK